MGFTISSSEKRIYPGIARDAGRLGTADPGVSGKAHRHHQPSRSLIRGHMAVYVPKQYVPGYCCAVYRGRRRA